jgi:Tic22-like family
LIRGCGLATRRSFHLLVSNTLIYWCFHFGFHCYREASSDKAPAAEEDRQKFPALSQSEVEDWLEHIPVFAVTDSQGSGVVLKPDNETSVFYFFMSPIQANATLNQLKGVNTDMDLKVSAFSLGKIWFGLLQSGPEKEVTVSSSYR